MNTPASMREPSKCRSLQTLQADYSAFQAAGGDMRRAKFYNNVIAPYFFEVPLEQVCTHVTSMPSIYIHLTKTGDSSWTPYKSRNLLSPVQTPGVRVSQA